AIVEKDKVGGTCLHRGCIPSKALLHSASVYRGLKEAHTFGVKVSDIAFQMEKAQERKDNVVEQLYEGVQGLLKKGKISIYYGIGRILRPSIFSPLPGTISDEYEDGSKNTMLIPKNIIIETASKPRHLSNIEVDGKFILNSNHILEINEIPDSILIVGGGVIGIEWASLLQDIGANVTVVENDAHILMQEDKDVRLHV